PHTDGVLQSSHGSVRSIAADTRHKKSCRRRRGEGDTLAYPRESFPAPRRNAVQRMPMDAHGPSQPRPPAMEIIVWGARGSVPTPAADHLYVGGNTSCIEVRVATGETFIFDAGTGI